MILAVGKPNSYRTGNSSTFVHTVVECGRELLGFSHLELTVVDFNKYAIRTYEKIGFKLAMEYKQIPIALLVWLKNDDGKKISYSTIMALI